MNERTNEGICNINNTNELPLKTSVNESAAEILADITEEKCVDVKYSDSTDDNIVYGDSNEGNISVRQNNEDIRESNNDENDGVSNDKNVDMCNNDDGKIDVSNNDDEVCVTKDEDCRVSYTSMDIGKEYYDESCTECKRTWKEPFQSELIMYLHALNYKVRFLWQSFVKCKHET